MELILTIIAFAFLIAGLVGSIAPVIPGPPLSFIGLIILQLSGRAEFSVPFLIIWAVITIAVTVLDYILPSIMTKKFGGSRYASIGAVIGLIAGIFIFPPIGLILGPFLGALVGELIHSNSQAAHSLKVALGAFLAFFVGTGAKLIVCSIMLFYAIIAMF